MSTHIIFNGQEYPSTDAMPEEVRKSYLQALAQFADNDRNGIPDVLERGAAGPVIGIQQSSITVNGRTYESVEAMPKLVRLLYEHALGVMGAGPSRAGARSTPGQGPAGADLMRAVSGTARLLERMVQVLLAISAVVILGGAVFIMLHMGGVSHRKERLYVAIAALVLLGTLDSGVERLVKRRTPLSLETTEVERRYSSVSLLLILGAAVLLIGLAWFLP